MNKLFELALECAKNGHGVTLGLNREKNRLEFTIQIGSKTGTGIFYEEGEEIILETRYNRKNIVENFQDIGKVAYEWFCDYKDREPFGQPDTEWVEYFVKNGFLKRVTKTVYE
jgi:hypothetical protein